MNRKLKLALISYASEKGFALPVVIGMGLIMTLIGMTMIMRSQGDQVTASAQRGTAQSLAVAEGGVSRVLSKLNTSDYSFLLTKDFDEWKDAIDSSPSCSDDYNSDNKYQEIVRGEIGESSGEYKIKNYQYENDQGTLTIEGTTGNRTNSKSWIQVVIPVETNIKKDPCGINFPGLYAESIDMGNNDLLGGTHASVFCTGCNPGGNVENQINKKNQSVIAGNILAGDPSLPEDLFKTSDSASNVHDVGAI